MSFNFKRFLSLVSGIALASCMTLGCDEDTPDTGNENTGNENTGNENTTPSGDHNIKNTCNHDDDFIPDWTQKNGKKEDIVNYLVDICRLSTYFQTPEFLDKPAEEQVIGSECFCYGRYCEMVGYERPEAQVTPDKDAFGEPNPDVYGTIYGCDAVVDYMGAQKSCFRSSNVEGIEPKIYFPNGTCALAMSKCTPKTANAEGSICSFAKFGDYSKLDTFTACPDMKEVLIDFLMKIEVKGVSAQADLDVRACFKGCKTDADCSGVDIYDPIAKAQSQTKCMEVKNADGLKAGVCFDPRTVEGVEDSVKLVHPGVWAL